MSFSSKEKEVSIEWMKQPKIHACLCIEARHSISTTPTRFTSEQTIPDTYVDPVQRPAKIQISGPLPSPLLLLLLHRVHESSYLKILKIHTCVSDSAETIERVTF